VAAIDHAPLARLKPSLVFAGYFVLLLARGDMQQRASKGLGGAKNA
jgi:hypothetical protein